MPVSVRRAVPADAALISSLNAEIQAVHAAALPQDFKPPDRDTFPPSAASALLLRPDNLLFIAELDELPAGYAYAEIIRRPETPQRFASTMLYLHHIGVRSACRKHGVGTALMEALREAGRAAGIERIALDVWAFNENARSFFRRHGFSTYNERMWTR